MKLNYLVVASILLFMNLNYSYSQFNKKNVIGIINDSVINKNLEFATIKITQKDKNEPIQINYSNKDGMFKISELDSGNYLISVTHVGYQTKEILVEIKGEDINLGVIYLKTLPKNLQEVIVKSKKLLIDQNDEKTTYNVEGDPIAKTQKAIDILRKTPFVSVDAEGNIQINGQSNFLVLLNGKETAMFAKNVKEALKAFPGSIISKIEVITNPSAKYDAEGVGGIINIITKKKVAGYNTTLNASKSSVGFYDASANINVKAGKLGVSLNYSLDGVKNVIGSNRGETIALQPSFIKERTYDGKRELKSFWHGGNLEANYEMDTLNVISTYINLDAGNENYKSNQNFITTFPTALKTESIYNLDHKNESPTLGIGSDYIRKFKSNREKEFSIRLNLLNSKINNELNSVQLNPTTNDRYVINKNISNDKQYTVQSDIILPFKKERKLETGIKAIFRNAFSNFESGYKILPNSKYEIDNSNTDNFKYNQNVYSAYGSYKFKIKNINIRAGLRYEHTAIDGVLIASSVKISQNYNSFLPNLLASFKIKNKLNFSLNYNVRIQRPYIRSLNPSINNNDSLNVTYGNPNLQPQTIHNFSLQTKLSKGNTFAGISLSGSYSNNLIVQFSEFNKTTGVTTTTSLNIGKEIQLSLNTNLSTKFNENFDLSINGNIRYNKVENNSTNNQVNSGVGGNMNMNTTYNINKKVSTNAYAGFWKAPVSIQGTFGIQYWYGIGLSYKLWNESLTISLNGVNFLQKNVSYTNTFTDPFFKISRTNTLPFGGIGLAISWNFGKLTEGVSRKKGVKNDDLLAPSSNN